MGASTLLKRVHGRSGTIPDFVWSRGKPAKQLDDATFASEAGTKSRKTLLAELKACSNAKNIEKGKEIHVEAMESRSDSCIYVATALVHMYAKCGNMVEARQVFDSIKHPTVVSWTALILGYAENGKGVVALDLFDRMKGSGCAPNFVTFVAALKACTSLALKQDESGKVECRERGKKIHSELRSDLDIYVQNTLIDMYAKCGSMFDAHHVFESIPYPDVVSWNVLILGYAENGDGVTALDLFARMKFQGYAPNSITFVSALKACSCISQKDGSGKVNCRYIGQQIHSEIGLHSNPYVQNTLIDMYGKCNSMIDARQVFNCMTCPDVVSWTALISGYAENGEGVTALDLFAKMSSHSCAPESMTFVAALKACTSLALEQEGSIKREYREQGKRIHSMIACQMDIYVQNTLIHMYSKFGSMKDARQVFESIEHPDVVSWNALMMGYAENGEGVTVLDLFSRMKSEGCAPDSITLVSALKACTCLALDQDGRRKAELRERGRQIYLESACHSDMCLQSTLMDMYAKCESMFEAQQVFDGIPEPDVVSWNTLMLGYAENGQAATALDLFAKMVAQGCAPNSKTFVAAFKACGLLGDLESGRRIHAKFHAEIRSGTERDARILVTCLVDFYAKCGSMVEAQTIFDRHPRNRDLITWNALLAGYSQLGDRKVFEVFNRMLDAGFQPDGVTFLCILTCCSHTGLVEKAKEFLEAMHSNYGVTPKVEHYTCMIDILGRLSKLNDALALLRSMPCKPNYVTWMTILSACYKWENVQIGRLVFKSLVSLDATNPAAYILMSHIYGNMDMWEEQQMILEMRRKLQQAQLIDYNV